MTARVYPALDLSWPEKPNDDRLDQLAAELDEFHPNALEDHPAGFRAYFTTIDDRDRAADAVAIAHPEITTASQLISDDSWAERSQAALTPVRVGHIVVRPPWAPGPDANDSAATITIQPSMGFGTGHHQSTRLCLRCLQMAPLSGRTVIDIGTGSGVLAIAASMLGAARVVAVDVDQDALTSARENLDLNQVSNVELRLLDVSAQTPPPVPDGADVITANLSGALLERLAPLAGRWLHGGGTLIASGFQLQEEETVTAALRRAGLVVVARLVEDDWLAVTASPTRSTAR
jgi:ribosomal protein L11 methyltransferase